MNKFLAGLMGVVATANPLVGGALSLVNGFLPDDKKLPAEATGEDVQNAYNGLPADAQAKVDQRAEIELASINASVDKLDAMVSVESKSGNTRPHIAVVMAWVVALAVVGLLFIIGVGVWNKDADTLEKVTTAWPLFLAILGTPTALLRAYFGLRTKEKKARYAAATGQPISGMIGSLANLIKR